MKFLQGTRLFRVMAIATVLSLVGAVSVIRYNLSVKAKSAILKQDSAQGAELTNVEFHPNATAGPVHSSPIVISPTKSFVWVVNPDNNSVSVLDIREDANRKDKDIPVGKEPQSLAFNADGSKVYVANAVDGTVSVISTQSFAVVNTITVGTEPWALAFTPSGNKLYVSNSNSQNVSVIDPKTDKVINTVSIPSSSSGERSIPRALAISNNGDFSDDDEKVYVCHFLAETIPGRTIGADNYKLGRVSILSAKDDKLIDSITVSPLDDTGFKSDGDALGKIPPKGNNTFEVTTGAFPNQLAGFFIKGNKAYIPSQGASPNGPVRFNVILQPLISVVDLAGQREIGQPFNANRGFNFEPAKEVTVNGAQVQFHRFHTVPVDLAFKHNSNVGYLVLSGSDCILRVELDDNGNPTVLAPTGAEPEKQGNFERILVGKNPRGMVINEADTRGYVWNYVSRDVTVIDLTKDARKENNVIGTIQSATLPSPGSPEGIVQLGKELFFTTIGPMQKRATKANILEGAMSDSGWCGCATCHPNGLTDGVVWMFPDGPRRSISLNQTFNPKDPSDQRILNWSAVRDEVQDFELNTRGVAGGQGLILKTDGTPDVVVNLTPTASSNRDSRQDAINEYCKTIRSPISPLSQKDKDVVKGRGFFKTAGCVSCHSGGKWTTSKVDFKPPPPADRISATGEISSVLKKVGTFNANNLNEVIGTGANISKTANGVNGFNPASLLSAFISGPYLHNGEVATLDKVLDNADHVGPKAKPILKEKKKRAKLVKFLESIDANTTPFPVATK